ncbi:signal recognition particle-docking protein FtsY [Kordiimonas marina]|uniref:signal recognition particle-docking protein FtsY n=1 Tax=Kordiimonas marina TaxID=2872312 RepID=UPI001FF56EF0|nr:signal recognition particle-docking protein FtsY [Kordiimonas marina]MCJ9430711.1 signal recognition particle-docking protein FtsY [Kordiimonas marina]
MAEEKKSWFQRLRGKKSEQEAQAEGQPAAEAPVEVQPEPTQEPEALVETVPLAEPTAAPEVEAAPEPAPEPEPTPVAEEPAAEEPAPEEPTEAKPQRSWFQRLKDGLKKSTSALSGGIAGIFTQAKLDDDTLEELEDLLITSDLGVTVASKLTTALAKGRYNKEISGEEVKQVLAAEIEAMLAPVAKPLVINDANKPHIILMAGVNGAGKTTTIGKLAKKFREDGKSVMLAAGDTFRAAAVEQLQVWGERNNVPVVTKEIGSDAAALAYEAVERAAREGIDVLLIDTAGRLQNREELMAELAKVVRVIGKKIEGAPHDTVIVLDATTGQNAIHQVEVFQKLANISGIVMTKLDGSARGGVLVACADKFGLPVHAIGVGEAIDDLQPFSAREFARALVGLEG